MLLIPIPASYDSDSNPDSNNPGFDSDTDSRDTRFSPKRRKIWVICIFGSSLIPDQYQFGTSIDLTVIIIVKSSPVTVFAIGMPTRGGTSREHLGRVSGT